MRSEFMTGTLYAFGAVVVLVAGALWYALGMPGGSHKGALPPATPEENALAARLKQHVTAVASKPHNIRQAYAELEAAAAYIERALTDEGYRVNSQAYETDGQTVRNLEAVIEPAKGGAAVKTIVVGAHYDSALGTPGANDNGSGVAAVIELARLLRDFRPEHTRVRLALFVNEEPPYFHTTDMGSYRYAQMLSERGEPVTAMISLETIGYFSDAPGSQKYPQPFGAVFPDRANFVAFVGTPGSRSLVRDAIASFRRHTAFPSIGGVAPGFVPGIDWSDHWGFAQHGFQAIMITDTAIFRYPHYHRPTDTPDKVDYERLARVTKGVERVIRDLAK